MKKFLKHLGLFMLSLYLVFAFQPAQVNAAMADEAEEYELGTDYSGHLKGNYGYDCRYLKFTITEKSRVTLKITATPDDGSYSFTACIYNNTGKVVLNKNDFVFKENSTTNILNGELSRILSAGTYYLELYGYDTEYTLSIQAEKQIKLSKGNITSLKSNKKGQMTLKCKSEKNAIGYRIQYSTDYKFKKNVKTVYAPTTTTTLKKLKAGKYYYVKVCPFTVYDDGSYVFGQNSYVKQVYIKKK